MMDESGMEPHPDPEDIADANESMAEDDSGLLGGDGQAGGSSSTATDDSGLLGGDDNQSGHTGDERTATDDRQRQTQSGDDAGTSGGTGAADGNESDDGPSLTRLEYNKVMRLLQNRELPVDRAEIREVALNAYEIEASQFEAVIDAAIDKDLIAEENGKFVAPE